MIRYAISATFLLAMSLSAAEPERKGPLADLPSKPGAHLDKIKALGDDTWLDLGAAAADRKWGRARGRSWSSRMPFAPDLGGAFLFGEGVHGWAKPDGHYMDDLWFYDLNAHRWVCCYPGADIKNIELKINADGFETTRDGEPLPIASMVHGYEMVTYDTDLKRFMSMPCPGGYSKPLNDKIKELWKDKQPPTRKGASPWLFDTISGKWDRKATPTKSPASSFGDTLIYVPTKKQHFFRHLDEGWFYDPAKNEWTDAAPKGPKHPFGIDATACYDSKRDKIYLGGGSYPVTPKGTNAFRIYDVQTNTWSDPKPKGSPCKGSNSYATNIAVMNYDTVNDVVVLFRTEGSEDERGIYTYDPATNTWTEEPKALPRTWKRCRSAYYDPTLNVHVFHAAGDSQDDGSVWVYRYKGGKK